ncbi:MAG TPA: UbiA family prenyltransferase [Dongiaceae bacterium]|nr:UbiA family prenyltransferase [Dongiaceae bacterium]
MNRSDCNEVASLSRFVSAKDSPKSAAGGQASTVHTAPFSSSAACPLVVDLDGTLVKTDLLLESLCRLLRQQPLAFFALPVWLLKGRAHLKKEIARRVEFDATPLPYRTELVDYLRAEHEKGRMIVLATGADELLARKVADHVGLFDLVLASDGTTNLSGERKRVRLVDEFGLKGFEYAGNDSHDLAVWPSAKRGIVVNPSPRLLRVAARFTEAESAFAEHSPSFGEYVSALRPRHWLKNVLVFAPILAAHFFLEPVLWFRTLLAFMGFCCCASSGYLINDLCDLPADRHHPEKRFRPFASGRLPLGYGLGMAPALAVFGCVLAGLLSGTSLAFLALYFALTLAYSFGLKKVVLLDVNVLAGLYTLRVIAGGIAIGIWPSVWLVAFSIFIFISLAFVKRYAELVVMRGVDGDHARARSYELNDAELLASKGTAAGYAAVVVLALYIASGAVKVLYSRPQVMWCLCPLLLYWIGYVWLIAHRGRMDTDPLVFAVHDRTSRILILLMLAAFLLSI